eukprot:10893569-Prorocentrum_lima.AAC.1
MRKAADIGVNVCPEAPDVRPITMEAGPFAVVKVDQTTADRKAVRRGGTKASKRNARKPNSVEDNGLGSFFDVDYDFISIDGTCPEAAASCSCSEAKAN